MLSYSIKVRQPEDTTADAYKVKIRGQLVQSRQFKFECPFNYQYIYRMFNPIKTNTLKELREQSIQLKRKQVLPINEDCFVNQSLKASNHDIDFRKIEFLPNKSDKVQIKKGFIFENVRLKKFENIFMPIVFRPLKESKDFNLGRIEFLWKRNTDDPRYVYCEYEEKDSLICEFVNNQAELTYNNIPEAYIGKHMQITYLLKNRTNKAIQYIVYIDESEHFFVTGNTNFELEIAANSSQEFEIS